MTIVTILKSDLEMLGERFSHLVGIDFTSIDLLIKSIKKLSQEDNEIYTISQFLSLSFGHIDGYYCAFFFGNGHTLNEIFGYNRVYVKSKN